MNQKCKKAFPLDLGLGQHTIVSSFGIWLKQMSNIINMSNVDVIATVFTVCTITEEASGWR